MLDNEELEYLLTNLVGEFENLEAGEDDTKWVRDAFPSFWLGKPLDASVQEVMMDNPPSVFTSFLLEQKIHAMIQVVKEMERRHP